MDGTGGAVRHPWMASTIRRLVSVFAYEKEARYAPTTMSDLSGFWSRRITGGHRLVYTVEGRAGLDQHVIIVLCGRPD